MKELQIIALDLEGTLISNAVSQIARPGLHGFLEFCKVVVRRVVIYTSVYEAKFRDVAGMLVTEGSAPQWFREVEYVNWSGKHKDLKVIPDAEVARTVLVDDFEGYVLPGQEEQQIPILPYSAPYAKDDAELSRVRQVLEDEWNCCSGEYQ